MMKVIKIKELEDCFDGSFIKEALLDNIVSKDFIFYLGKEGELQYYPSFARPFYKVEIPGKYILKGVEGNKTIRIILNRKNIEFAEKQCIELINCY